ncbi:DUF6262 family protein [Paenibacillus thalictri]|uniref:Transposase n=1 Tax=Paenibacillus thalictri TaxID=2527873 RepID=A0A4Q9DHS7_9BACL|nr:DUF6262 family protein [Paenibacillus thalictri]TBL69917.1 transposase [Paenibacillus thalictri]
MQKRNVDGIKQFSKLKTRTAIAKAEEAIDRLLKNNMKVNFNSVSLEAGVSKPFLYTQSALRIRIEELRIRTERWGQSADVKSRYLELENERLRSQISKLERMITKLRNA